MARVCPTCHSDNNETSRFCSNCAAPLSRAGSPLDSFTKTIDAPLRILSPGSLIAGKYRIIDEIGRGGMGIVYKAEDIKLKRSVALKFLPPHFMDSPELKERFIIEAQAAAALSHPNICVVHEVGEADDRSFIAMEYVEGETLRDKIKKGPLNPKTAIDIAIQIAAGLSEAHRKGIIHRDIKSANIMVTDKGQAKVMDFGLAKLRGGSSLTRSQTTLGTVAYMSPEQARGEDVDGRTDLWSLGIVLYEMLTGELPFKGDRDLSIIYSIVHEEPKSLTGRKPSIPPELQHVVARALKKNREARYPSAETLLADLKKFQEALQLAASGVLNVKTLGRRIRNPRIAVPAIAVLAVLTFVGVRFFNHRADVRWARNVALPEIEKLIGQNDVWRNLSGAFRLAEKTEALIPSDPKLAILLSKCSLNVNIRTEPSGAKIFIKDYTVPQDEWTYLGISPIEKRRLPTGIFRWKMEKESYDTVLAAASTWGLDLGTQDILVPQDLTRILDRRGSIPPGMVRVTGAETAAGKLEDFFIDTYEVTNRQYKEFAGHGGYRDRKYWKQNIVKEGRELGWEAAVKEFVDQTGQPGPSTWQAGDYPEGQGDYPVSGISWYEAAAYAEFAGKALPTGAHWGIARGESTTLIQFPQLGGFALIAPYSNFQGKGLVAVGSLPGMTPYGAFDMAGNVREWCSNETLQGRLIRGGAWGDPTYMFDVQSQAPALDRSPKNGFRCALYPDPAKIPPAVFAAVKLPEAVDYYKIKPVPDSVFQVYRDLYSYDKTDLRARVETTKSGPDWIREKISLDAAYGGERVTAYLFLPRNAAPPYQTIVYFPGSASALQRSSENIESYYEYSMFLSFLVKNGRAVLYPVYKGTFERGSDATDAVLFGDVNARSYAELTIQEIKDLRRSVDYLQTRPDIDGRKLAYYGLSWGGWVVIPVLEERFKTVIFVAGGIVGSARAEINDINFLGRFKAPALMLNGRYDTLNRLDTAIKPMFDLLGTPADQKRLILYETDHIPPMNEMIKESLAWLDKYLGPVKK
jgi:serine/threonine protein kinase/dienelactone hydrolase